MVDRNYAFTTIEEDLRTVESLYMRVSQGEELPIVNVIPSKAGLDDVNGKYVNLGAVVFGKVSSRGNDSRSGVAQGYRIGRVLCDEQGKVVYNNQLQYEIVEEKLVTKDQAIYLTQVMGSLNSYIRSQEQKDSKGEVIKTSIYLRPIPAKTEAFFLDGRVVSVYRLDEYGYRASPITLNVKEKDCTLKLWELIQNDYRLKRNREKPKKNILEVQKENERKIQDLRQSLINSNVAMINPFAKKDSKIEEN